MKTAMPLAVADRNTEPASETAAMMATAEREPERGHDQVGPATSRR